MENWEIFGLIVGVIGTSLAIYQYGVLNESKKRRNELQYLLAGINNSALLKQQSWQNQISLLKKPENEEDWESRRVYLRARDDFGEIASLVLALEGTIDTESSAITSMLEKSIKQIQLNNKLQEEALKNPTIRQPENQNKSTKK